MQKKEGGIEHLKEELYSRGGAPSLDPHKRTPLSPFSRSVDGIKQKLSGRIIGGKVEGEPEETELPHESSTVFENSQPLSIASMTKRMKSHSFAPFFLWGSLLFFFVAAVIAGITFFGGTNTISPSRISIQIVAPSLIDSGKPTTLEYIVTNNNSTKLFAADLIITYPPGTRSQNDNADLPRERLTLGDVAAGDTVKQTSTATFFGGEGSQQQVAVELEYQIPGSNAVFVRQEQVNFTIGSSPVTISVDAPQEAISGQAFDMDVTLRSNSTTDITDLAFSAQYPFGFVFDGSEPQGAAGGTYWNLGTLTAGRSKTIHIHGTLTGEDGDERVFHFSTGSQADQTATKIDTPLLSVPQSVAITKPFIAASIVLDGKSDSTIAEQLGQTVQGQVHWQNNLSDPVSDLNLTLAFGGAIDASSIIAGNGFYDSLSQSIIWSPTQDPSLKNVPPGASGTYQFSFKTAQPSSGMPNPKAMLSLTAHASRQGNVPQDISSAATTQINLASAVKLTAQALHFSGGISNSGPMPPKANQKTTYTVLLTVSNSSNTIAGARVETSLPPYVDFEGGASGEAVSYDPGSRTVVWNLGDVKAGVGFGSSARQAAFQVSLTPSTSQIGQSPSLTSNINFSGQDRFAQVSIAAMANAPTIQLSGDSGYTSAMGIVTQ